MFLGAVYKFSYLFMYLVCLHCHYSVKCARLLFNWQDLPLGLMDDIHKWCHGCLQVINEVDDVLTENRIWRLRTKDIGIVSAEDAINLGFRFCSVFTYVLKGYLQ